MATPERDADETTTGEQPIASDKSFTDENSDPVGLPTLPLSQRATLTLLSLGELGLLSGPAPVQQGKQRNIAIDANVHKLFNRGKLEMIDDRAIENAADEYLDRSIDTGASPHTSLQNPGVP